MIAMLYVIFLVFVPFVSAEETPPVETVKNLLFFSEDFERDPAVRPWRGGGDVAVITASDPLIRETVRPYFGNNSRFVRFRIGNGKAAMEIPVRVPVKASLSFFHKTDIDGGSGQLFRVLVDGKEERVITGLDHVWKREEGIPLEPGDHLVRFELVNGGVLIKKHDNAVYVDTVTVAADVVHHLTVGSPGRKETRVGAPSGERLVFVPRAHRIDGSILPMGMENFDLLVTGEDGTCYGDGVIDGEGALIPLTPGTYRVRAALKDMPEINGLSGGVVVHDRDFLADEPYRYPGTGHTYLGYTGGREAGEPITYRSITVNFPLEREFDADGFFTLRGTVRNQASLDHVRLVISRLDSDGELSGDETSDVYYLHKEFDTRIWLRYGKGKYRGPLPHIEHYHRLPYGGRRFHIEGRV